MPDPLTAIDGCVDTIKLTCGPSINIEDATNYCDRYVTFEKDKFTWRPTEYMKGTEVALELFRRFGRSHICDHVVRREMFEMDKVILLSLLLVGLIVIMVIEAPLLPIELGAMALMAI